MPANRMNRLCSAGAAVLTVLTLTGASAFGDGPVGNPPPFLMTWDASGDTVNPLEYDPNNFINYVPSPGSLHNPGAATEYGTWTLGGPAGTRVRTGWRYQGGFVGIDNAYELSWDCVINPDPFVDATINITNNTDTTQTYWIYMPLAIVPPIGPGTIMNGSVSAVVSDQNFDGAILATDGINPIYRAFIDTPPGGTPAQTLWSPGYTLSSGSFASANDTISFTNQLGPSANTDIGILLRFTLSGGDSASVTGIFEILPVPGPAGLAAMALFGAMCGGRGRRRTN